MYKDIHQKITKNANSEIYSTQNTATTHLSPALITVTNILYHASLTGKGTTDAIFMARQMQENFRVKGKKLYIGFVDLEKAFDRVPREVISWAMRKLGVEEWLSRVAYLTIT